MVALHRLTGGRREITERLTIEITETAAIHDLDQSIAFVDTLKELGCRVAIDDFGAGYTSFKNLKHLAVDMVKIDGAFVKNLTADKADADLHQDDGRAGPLVRHGDGRRVGRRRTDGADAGRRPASTICRASTSASRC